MSGGRKRLGPVPGPFPGVDATPESPYLVTQLSERSQEVAFLPHLRLLTLLQKPYIASSGDRVRCGDPVVPLDFLYLPLQLFACVLERVGVVEGIRNSPHVRDVERDVLAFGDQVDDRFAGRMSHGNLVED